MVTRRKLGLSCPEAHFDMLRPARTKVVEMMTAYDPNSNAYAAFLRVLIALDQAAEVVMRAPTFFHAKSWGTEAGFRAPAETGPTSAAPESAAERQNFP